MKRTILIAVLVMALAAPSAEASWFSELFPSGGGHNKHNYHNNAPAQQQPDNPVSVPEPASLILLGAGLVGLAAWKRVRR